MGSHLARALIQNKHQVIGLKRRSSDVFRLADIIHAIQLHDIDDGLESVLVHYPDATLIIHAATAYGNQREPLSDLMLSNVVMPLKLLEWAVSRGDCVFINTDTFFSKASNGYTHLTDYIASKALFLQLGMRFAKASNVTFLNMRLEHMFGPFDGKEKFTTSIVRQLLANAPEIALTPGQQLRDFVYIDDVVDAYLAVIHALEQHGLRGSLTFEVGSGQPRSVMDFVTTAHRIVRSKSKLLFGALPYREQEIMRSEANLGALQALGWEPRVTLEAGIERLVASLRHPGN